MCILEVGSKIFSKIIIIPTDKISLIRNDATTTLLNEKRWSLAEVLRAYRKINALNITKVKIEIKYIHRVCE